MDLVTQYKEGLEQLKKAKAFLQELNPVDYELRSFINTIDIKINKTEQSLHSFQGKTAMHRCGLCDRSYDEDEPQAIENTKVCPYCREIGSKFLLGSDFEQNFNLPKGTIKRDCLSINGNDPKLKPYMDIGLVTKSGIHNLVHLLVYDLYYANADLYKRRKTKNQSENE